MPVNRRELISKLDKLIAAEQEAQPPGIVGSLVQDLETISEEAEEETLSLTRPPGLLDTFGEGS
jgi:hypothetical protein